VGKYRITVVNEEFSASNEYDGPDELAAREHAVESVLAIATEQVKAGKPYFGAHVTIAQGESELLQLVVSAGASPLTPDREE
jgi:hypothetical protein